MILISSFVPVTPSLSQIIRHSIGFFPILNIFKKGGEVNHYLWLPESILLKVENCQSFSKTTGRNRIPMKISNVSFNIITLVAIFLFPLLSIPVLPRIARFLSLHSIFFHPLHCGDIGDLSNHLYARAISIHKNQIIFKIYIFYANMA